MLFACAPVSRADEWVTCQRHASTVQLVLLRGKASEPLENALFRLSATNPDLGTWLVSNDQLRNAHGLRFCLPRGLAAYKSHSMDLILSS